MKRPPKATGHTVRYPLSHPALTLIMLDGGWSLRWTGFVCGPFAIGVMWKERR